MEAEGTRSNEAEFRSMFDLLRQLTPEHDLLRLAPTNQNAVYTTLVTLWMITLQRLNGGASLVDVVRQVLEHSRDIFPNNKRVREGTLSSRSGSYSEARKRLPVEATEFFANSVCNSLIDRSPSWFDDRRAFIIDGTTITLAPTSELTRLFPPATNQHGTSVWPVLLMVVAHELQSGCALLPEIGAMYGDDNTSETRLAANLAARLPKGSLVLADSAYGIFSVAYALRQKGHDILLRLTRSRFQKLRRRAELIERTESASSYRLRWQPSAADRRTNPDLPADAALDVLLHEHHTVLKDGKPLLLVTVLECDSDQAADIYSRRYDVEHDIRDVKVTLGFDSIRAKSHDMLRKELHCGIVAYNLVQAFRRQAAQKSNVPPRRLSFTAVWTTFRISLLQQSPSDPATWHERYEKALAIAAKDKLPNRPGRSYPRQAHKRCPRSSKFMTTPKTKPPQTGDPPPGADTK